MKKLLSVLVAIVFCFTLSVCSFAVDDDLIADIVDGVGDLVEAESEGDDEAVIKAIEKLYNDLQEARQTGDVSDVIAKAAEYAASEESDVSAVFTDTSAVEVVLNKVLTDENYDIDSIKKELQSSAALNTLVSLYTGAVSQTITNVAMTDSEPAADQNQPVVDNPATVDSTYGSATAIAVFSLSAAVIVVCSKRD